MQSHVSDTGHSHTFDLKCRHCRVYDMSIICQFPQASRDSLWKLVIDYTKKIDFYLSFCFRNSLYLSDCMISAYALNIWLSCLSKHDFNIWLHLQDLLTLYLISIQGLQRFCTEHGIKLSKVYHVSRALTLFCCGVSFTDYWVTRDDSLQQFLVSHSCYYQCIVTLTNFHLWFLQIDHIFLSRVCSETAGGLPGPCWIIVISNLVVIVIVHTILTYHNLVFKLYFYFMEYLNLIFRVTIHWE